MAAYLIPQTREIDLEHVGDIMVVFDNQKACFSHKEPPGF
jgi:hypothetical protein